MRILLLFILICFELTTQGQITFEKHYGGIEYNGGTSFKQTSDGGYILVGYTDGVGSSDMIKTNEYGDTLWFKVISDAPNYPSLSFIDLTSDGNFITTGGATPSSPAAYLGKYSSSGDTIWQKQFSGAQNAFGFCTHETSDGGFILIGSTQDVTSNEDVYMVKTDSDGTMMWSKQFGTSGIDEAFYGEETSDGGYILTGISTPNPGVAYDVYLVKTDINGDTLWTKRYGSSMDNSQDWGYCVHQTTDGGYVIAGGKMVPDIYSSHNIMWVLKTDANGDTTWTKSFDYGYHIADQQARSVVQTDDGGYVIAGYYNDSLFNDHLALIKLDENGDQQWKAYINGFEEDDQPAELQATSDGGFAVIGTAFLDPEDDIYFAKVDGNPSCDGLTVYLDADSDGYGNDDISLVDSDCVVPDGYVILNGDCNDSNPSVNPSATEICNGIDDNCNGSIDEGLLITYYIDVDIDGYGDLFGAGILFCNDPGVGYSLNDLDCNDSSAAINPSATEVCNSIDDNCNGSTDEGLLITYYVDADNDGYGDLFDEGILFCSDPGVGYSLNNNDCNDTVATINPTATEICNTFDDNCDGNIDEGLLITFYADEDGDNYGAANNIISACSSPDGYVSDSTDCDDSNAMINPSATELCNGFDDNCDGNVDEGLLLTFYQDADSDTYGDHSNSILSCTVPDGYVIDSTDCNDSNPAVNPSAIEVCNGIDDNCNGSTDEGLGFTYYSDADGDGYGDLFDVGILLCTDPGPGYSLNNSDCNDTVANINPAATEICNAVDDNCDGSIDEGVLITFYADADSDNFGNPAASILACSIPEGYVIDSTDCNDSSAAINPGVAEICNQADDNCDGNIDEGLQLFHLFFDGDNDGFGNHNIDTFSCVPIDGYVHSNKDCDDTNPNVNPDAPEIPGNGIDDNCDGHIDEVVGISVIKEDEFSISVYPNPTDGNFTLSLNLNGNESGAATIEVINLLGQVLSSQQKMMMKGILLQEIQLSDAAAEGMCLVKVIVNDRVYSSQVNYQK